MNELVLKEKEKIETTYLDLKKEIVSANKKVYLEINNVLLLTYFNLGKKLSIFLKDYEDEKYGNKVLESIAEKLIKEFGNGYSYYNLRLMIRFYETYIKFETVSQKLSFSHYTTLIKIKDNNQRKFYEELSINSSLSVRELKRAITTSTYERRLEIKEASREFDPKALVNDPYILDFLSLEDKSEKELEEKLLLRLKQFMLECGKGFMFYSEQFHIRIGRDNYYPDLIFYNRFTKSFVIIDLKIGKITPQDLGQMELYVKYFRKNMMIEGENPPIGIVLGSDKNEEVVNLMLDDNDYVFASKYLTYLPKKDEFKQLLKTKKK